VSGCSGVGDLRIHDKCMPQPVVAEAIDRLAPKRRWANEPISYPSGSNEGSYNHVLPDLKNDSIPTPRSKGKSKKDDSCNKSSLANSVKSYTGRKTQNFREKEERCQIKDDERMHVLLRQQALFM
jgi:hypothetical protein